MEALDYTVALKRERASVGVASDALTGKERAWLNAHCPNAWRIELVGRHVSRKSAREKDLGNLWFVHLPDKSRATAFKALHRGQPARPD